MSTSRLETTRLLAKVFNIEDFLSPDSLSHDELNYYNSITRVLDRHVDKYVDWLGTAEAQEAFYQESVQRKAPACHREFSVPFPEPGSVFHQPLQGQLPPNGSFRKSGKP